MEAGEKFPEPPLVMLELGPVNAIALRGVWPTEFACPATGPPPLPAPTARSRLHLLTAKSATISTTPPTVAPTMMPMLLLCFGSGGGLGLGSMGLGLGLLGVGLGLVDVGLGLVAAGLG